MTDGEKLIVRMRKAEVEENRGRLETKPKLFNLRIREHGLGEAVRHGWITNQLVRNSDCTQFCICWVLTQAGRRHSWKVEPGEPSFMTVDEYQALLGVI